MWCSVCNFYVNLFACNGSMLYKVQIPQISIDFIFCQPMGGQAVFGARLRDRASRETSSRDPADRLFSVPSRGRLHSCPDAKQRPLLGPSPTPPPLSTFFFLRCTGVDNVFEAYTPVTSGFLREEHNDLFTNVSSFVGTSLFARDDLFEHYHFSMIFGAFLIDVNIT